MSAFFFFGQPHTRTTPTNLPPLPPSSPGPGLSEDRGRLDQLITRRKASFEQANPNLERGQALFKNHCSSCHQINGEGSLLGPQLDGIGARGPARLSEDILDPNRNVDAHFYLTTLKLQDGTTTTGFIRGQSGAVLLLVDAAGKSHRFCIDAPRHSSPWPWLACRTPTRPRSHGRLVTAPGWNKQHQRQWRMDCKPTTRRVIMEQFRDSRFFNAAAQPVVQNELRLWQRRRG